MEIQSQDYHYQNNIDVSDMCAKIQYFLVVPLSAEEARKPENHKTIPYVVTFEDDQQTHLGDLMNEYRQMSKNQEKYFMYFTLKSGRKLDEQMSVRILKNSLGRDNINGTVLFVTVQKTFQYESIHYIHSQVSYIDECAVIQFLEQQEQFGSNVIHVVVQIPKKQGDSELMQIKVNNNFKGHQLIQTTISEIKKNFGVNLTKNDFQLLVKETNRYVSFEEQLINQKILNWSRIVLQLKKNIPLNRVSTLNCNHFIVIFKEGQIEPLRFEFAKIADLTFKQLYESKLQLSQSKHRKQLSYGLKIMDKIIAPHQKLLLAAPYFSFQTNSPYSIIGKVINQKQVFYYMISKIEKEKQQFKIDYIPIPQQAAQTRLQLRKKSIERTKIVQKDYFRNVERLQPIMIYTSELYCYEDSLNKKIAKIYESLNRYLRDQPLLSLEEKAFMKEWRYRYSCALLTHLQKAQKYKGLAYRGISYDPKFKKGSIVTFKQFVSTSLDKQVAIRFALGNNNPVKHLFELYIQQAYKIKQYSEYMQEEQALIVPFSEFVVTQIKTINKSMKDPVQNKNITVPIRVYVMKQIMKKQPSLQIKVNFVIWIDQNVGESANLFRSIQLPTQTTLFIQLQSTEELKKWLNKYSTLFNDPSANLVFITNMTRREGNTWNQVAGIQGFKEIRKFSKDIPVFFYIGDIAKTNQKLEKYQIYDENILVGQSPEEVQNYIRMHICQQF